MSNNVQKQSLKKIIAETKAEIASDPLKGLATFHSESRLQAGLQTEAKLRQHTIVVDEPESLGGTDAGPNPVELILAALGTCQEITYRAYATALGIPLEGVSVRLTGDIDLAGFLAVDDEARPGYRNIQGTVTLESTAHEDDLRKLRGVVDAHCPVLDILSNPVPVTLGLNIRQATVA